MQEINLLQNRVKDNSNLGPKQTKLTITVLSVVLIVVIGVTAMLFLLTHSVNNKAAVTSSENTTLQAKLDSQQSSLTQAETFQAQLANLHLLLNNHTYFSPLLDELAKMTYIKAQYVTLDAADTGKLHLEGRVSSYQDLGKLLLGLSTSKDFYGAKLLSAVPTTGKDSGYLFSIDLNSVPEIFTKK